MAIIYNAATTVNGFLADDGDSLQWLFDVPGSAEAESDITVFLNSIGAVVMGSTTYEWLLDALDSPTQLNENYGDRPIWVFSSRTLPIHPDTHVRVVNSPVSEILPRFRETPGDIWVMGGGDLSGQFLDAGALDRIILTIAPVFLPSGRPTLPRRLESDRLTLVGTRPLGQFVEVVYDVAGS